MRTHVIFDLDHTLFDTNGFQDAMRVAVAKIGLDEVRYWKAYRATMFRTPDSYDFAIQPFVAKVKLTCPDLADKGDALVKVLEEVLEKAGEHLYPGAAELLETARPHIDSMTLLTRGNVEWQKAKVNNTGIVRMFDKCEYVMEQKVDVLAKLLEDGEHTVFVNDNPEENIAVRRKFPDVTLLHVEGLRGTPPELVENRVVGIEGMRAGLSDALDVML